VTSEWISFRLDWKRLREIGILDWHYWIFWEDMKSLGFFINDVRIWGKAKRHSKKYFIGLSSTALVYHKRFSDVPQKSSKRQSVYREPKKFEKHCPKTIFWLQAFKTFLQKKACYSNLWQRGIVWKSHFWVTVKSYEKMDVIYERPRRQFRFFEGCTA
jgi:hypothetical protein